MDNQKGNGRKVSLFIALSIMLVALISGVGIGLAWGATLITDWENASKACCACVYGNSSAFGWKGLNNEEVLP